MSMNASPLIIPTQVKSPMPFVYYIVNVAEVITRTVEHLRKTGQLQIVPNCDPNTLWVHISGDTGGRSTNLMLRIVTTSNRQLDQISKDSWDI